MRIALLALAPFGVLPAHAQGFSDGFEGPNLDPRWEWFVPKAGPALSLTDSPGNLRLTLPKVPAGYNHWTGGQGSADAPLLLTAAPDGDFALECHLRVIAFDPDGNFHVTLTVAFSRRYLVGWGPYYSTHFGTPRNTPQVWCEPTGQGHYLADAAEARDVYLRIEKTGRRYNFAVRNKENEAWRRTGVWESAFPARYVGIMGKTFGDGGPVVVEVDSIRLEPLPDAAQPPEEATVTVDAAGQTWPLDPRRYGFFIEHIAKCIDGGLWAELLRNRKFTGRMGPDGVVEEWQPLTKGDGIRYSRDNAEYVCPAQSQRMTCTEAGKKFGLVQDKLSLRGGVDYRARVVAKQSGLAGPLQVALMHEGKPLSQIVPVQIGEDWTTREFVLDGPEKKTGAQLVITAEGRGTVWLGAVSLMPADNVDGMRADVLEAVREMKVPIVRWPGGNFVSQYDWRDGIGPRDKRPPRWNRAWNQWEWNDMGTDEFLRFCRLVATEPYICVNAGEGQAAEAAAWVEYCNGPADSTWGRVRAANGHPEPYGVKIWSLGNEMWGNWQHGNLNATNYGIKCIELARAMNTVDPTIQLIGDGVETDTFGNWNREYCPIAGPALDWLSVHFYHGVNNRDDATLNCANVIGAARYVEDMLSRTYDIATEAAGKPLPLAFDEWNVATDQPHNLRDGLFDCLVFHAMHRLGPRVPIATMALLINVFGALDVTPTSLVRSATHQAFELYSNNSGSLGVPVRLQSPTVGLPTGTAPALDAVGSLSEDRKRLYVSVVSRSTIGAIRGRLDLNGFEAQDTVRVITLNAASPEAANTPEHPDRVRLQEKTLPLAEAVQYSFPAHSATVMVFTAR